MPAGSFFEERGTILTAFILSYAFTSFIGGWVGGRAHPHPRRAALPLWGICTWEDGRKCYAYGTEGHATDNGATWL